MMRLLLVPILAALIGFRCSEGVCAPNDKCAGFTGPVRKVVYARGFCWLSTSNLDIWSNHYNNTASHHSRITGQMAVFTDADVRMQVWRLLMAPPAGMDASQLLFVSAKRDYYRTTAFRDGEKYDYFHWQSSGDGGLKIEIPKEEMEHNLSNTRIAWELNMHYMELWSKNGMLDNLHEAAKLAALYQYRPPPPMFFRWRRVPGVEGTFAVHRTLAAASAQAVPQCQSACARSMLCYAFTIVPAESVCRLHYEIARVVDTAVPNAQAALYYVVE